MDVALVCHEYPPYFVGGVGTYAYNLARFLSKKKINVTMYCGKSAKPSLEDVNAYLHIMRLPVLDISLRAYWFQFQNFGYLSDALGKHDIVHAISPQSATVAVALKSRHKRPVVTTIHNMPVSRTKIFMQAPLKEWAFEDATAHYIENTLEQLMVNYCIEKSDTIVMVGQTDFEFVKVYKRAAIGKIIIIPNGVDIETLSRLKEQVQLEETDRGSNLSSLSVVFVGRLNWLKGITHLIRALAIVKKDYPSVELRVIGKGPIMGRLLALVEDLDLVGNVHFVGFIGPNERKKLVEEIVRASVICLPSLYEPMANLAMLESMACEKAVLAFDLPFVRGVVSDGYNGLLARAGNVEDLAEKLGILLDDRVLRKRIGTNAGCFVRKHHDMNLVAEKYIKVYEALSRS